MGSVFLYIIIYPTRVLKYVHVHTTRLLRARRVSFVSPLSESVSVIREFQTGIALLSYYIQILLLLYPDTKVKPARLSPITQRVNKEKKLSARSGYAISLRRSFVRPCLYIGNNNITWYASVDNIITIVNTVSRRDIEKWNL